MPKYRDWETVEFENWLNNLKKEASMLYNDGSSISFEDWYRANEWSKLKTELEELNFRETKATSAEAKLAASYRDWETDRKSTRLNSSHRSLSRMPSSA